VVEVPETICCHLQWHSSTFLVVSSVFPPRADCTLHHILTRQFVCPTEILAFNNALEQFKAINTEVILFSTDSEYTHLAWANTPRKEGGLGPDLKVGLLADRNHAISKAYGVLLEEEGIDLRGTFFIDPNGTLRASHIHDLPVGRSVEETIRVIKAFQFTDEHGEVCPAGWEEGKDTIDTKDATAYFSKQ